MAKVSDAFPSRFLKADDLQNRDVNVTISSATIESIGQGNAKDRKIVLGFQGKDKQLVCNKTNSNTIAKLYGDETNDWIGKQITLFATEVEFQGDQVLSIRIRMRPPAPAGQAGSGRGTSTPPPVAKPAPKREDNTGDEGLDEDVPF